MPYCFGEAAAILVQGNIWCETAPRCPRGTFDTLLMSSKQVSWKTKPAGFIIGIFSFKQIPGSPTFLLAISPLCKLASALPQLACPQPSSALHGCLWLLRAFTIKSELLLFVEEWEGLISKDYIPGLCDPAEIQTHL